jgi:hypothetical protein
VSPNLTSRRARVAVELPAAGRSSRPYPLQIDLRYKVVRGGRPIQQGLGRTRRLSTAEVSFSADQNLPGGADVELSVNWPLPLGGVCPLQLLIFGRVIRSGADGSTVKIARYEFRTRRFQAESLRQPIGGGGLAVGEPRSRDASRAVSVRRV